MSPRKRKGPAPTAKPSRKHTNQTKFNRYLADDGYAAPTAEDRREVALLAEAAELGYRLSLSCIDCGHPLVAPMSVSAMRGPVCRARKRADK